MSELSVAEAIETIWASHVRLVEDMKTVRMWEPGEIDRKLLPMASLYFLLPEGRVIETGGGEEVGYAWEVSLYVSLTKWETAQKQMREMAFRMVANFRDHRDDYDDYPLYELFAGGMRRRVPPTPGEDDQYLRASWEMTISVGER